MFEQSRKWNGSWIWPSKEIARENETVLFRKTFELPVNFSMMRIYVSADSRYRLFVNGSSVGVGPCKGDAYRKYYEAYELRGQLSPGSNTIAVKVAHYAPGGPKFAAGPSAVHRTAFGGLIVDAEVLGDDGAVQANVSTDSSWRCIRDESTSLFNESWMSGIWMGGVERKNGFLYPHGWELPEYDDSHWSYATPVMETIHSFGVIDRWPLMPRTIPPLTETPKKFAKIMRSEGWPADKTAEAAGLHDVLLAPRSRAWIEIDAGELTTAYLRAGFSGGRGASVRLLPAECYERKTESGGRLKSVRDEASEDSFLLGDSDVYRVAGIGADSSSPEIYEPFWFRTFRFVRLEIETADEPLTFHSLEYRETGYPLEAVARFGSSDPSSALLWDISIRTLKRCMHETYEDCPYYEQLQYTMDTALQMLFTYNVSGDDRLARKAIHDYHCSRLPDGMLQARYPTVEPQVIPGFALYWVFMLHDHYSFFGDKELIRAYLPTADGVLEWFRRRIGSDGLVGPAPEVYWSYVDWVEGWHAGVPGAASHGPLTVYSLMFAAALRKASELQDALGRSSTGEEYRRLADAVNASVREHCRSAADELFSDGPATAEFSQHGQIWAVLSGAVTGDEAVRLLEAAMMDKSLPQVSYSMAFFLFRALEKAGLYERSFVLWEQWRAMAELHLTTWAEDPAGARSDCHAWGAAPLYEFPRAVLGIRPELPGFSKLAVEPRPGPLRYAEGTMATPRGLVYVRFEREDGSLAVEVDGPPDVPLCLRLPDGSETEYASSAGVRQKCRLTN